MSSNEALRGFLFLTPFLRHFFFPGIINSIILHLNCILYVCWGLVSVLSGIPSGEQGGEVWTRFSSVAQSCPTLLTPWTVAHQGPLSREILQARILEWVAMPFSRGSSQPRDWTQISCIADGFFTLWATREALTYGIVHVSMLFSQITPPLPPPTEFKSLFFTSVSPLLPCI